MHIDKLLERVADMKASDLHLTTGVEAIARVHGILTPITKNKLKPEDTLGLVRQMLTENELQQFVANGEVDTAYSLKGVARFRVNAFKQRGSCAAALRMISDTIPTIDELNLPPLLKKLSLKKRGLILITGPTGSGKSTSLAAMIDYMNENSGRHIITIEDPIEYLHRHKNSVINQRQIGKDSLSFSNALRAALRQDPDVILVGEMRDLETISIAVTAAETGHLVLSTLHTIGAAKTIDRAIDVFPGDQQKQIRTQLASVIEAVISQQIMPKSDASGRVAAFEIMTATPAIRNLVREGKTHQIQSSILTGADMGMITMDSSLLKLSQKGIISRETALGFAVDQEELLNSIGM